MQAASTPQGCGEEQLPVMQNMLDCWVGNLGSTGGAINPSKSHWYLLDFEWTGSQWVYRPASSMPGELHAPDPHAVATVIARHEPHEAEKYLGIQVAADGNMRAQTAQLLEKGHLFANRTRMSPLLTKNEAWLNYTLTIYKTLEYPMPATTMSAEDWRKVMTPINSAALPKAGIVRTMAHAVVYGPRKYQGLGVMEPWHNQELTHLTLFADQITQDTSLGARLRISTEALRMETGYPGHFTDVPFAIAVLGPPTAGSRICGKAANNSKSASTTPSETSSWPVNTTSF